MASNIKYPENQAMYFIEGDTLALITKVDSSGNGRTSTRKQWKAISEAVTNGLLLHYYAEPNSVTSITSNLDIDNTLELAVVDYVKSMAAEMAGQLELKEYYMKEFYGKLGDNESNKRKISMSFPAGVYAVR